MRRTRFHSPPIELVPPLMKGFLPSFLRMALAAIALVTTCVTFGSDAHAWQSAGSISGVVYDEDFEVTLPGVEVQVIETGVRVISGAQGSYVFGEMVPGTYTLIFSKVGYVRQVRGSVVVSPGRLTELDVWLPGDFTEMEEFVVRDVLGSGTGSAAALDALRLDSPSIMSAVGAEEMSRAGASDASDALKLVAGATVQDGKFAVIRGLPDRYVNSQLNGIRLPTADEDKRAVQLDQFPSAVIDSVQVTKTFTPDQQGDASGGAVNVDLKGVPAEATYAFKAQFSVNSQVAGSDFLSYTGGGVGTWGKDDGGRDIQFNDGGSHQWDGAVGVKEVGAPVDFKLGLSGGNRWEIDRKTTFGAFGSFFYDRDSSFFDNGKDDSLWQLNPGDPLTPETKQGPGTPGSDFNTALFDITKASQSVQWGGLASFGLEWDEQEVNLNFLYTHVADDVATLATDTRGKAYFYPGYDPYDPTHPGNQDPDSAPYLRSETLAYTERTTRTWQLTGSHELDTDAFSLGSFDFHKPVVDWSLSQNFARLYQPDKRQFGASYVPGAEVPSFPPGSTFITDPFWVEYKPAANINVGNLQRTWKDIVEESDQLSLDLELPFDQWSGDEGAVKVGAFFDDLQRTYGQQSFSNPNDFWTVDGDLTVNVAEEWAKQTHLLSPADIDVPYDGFQDIQAFYAMLELPTSDRFKWIGGARFETTKLQTELHPEPAAQWYPNGDAGAQFLIDADPSEYNQDFYQEDLLPSIGFVFDATPDLTLQVAASKTVARQTFKEITPILHQEFLGGPVFIGNPDLKMSELINFDVRADYRPYAGGLYSVSWFYKDVKDPIEHVEVINQLTFTSATNYPEGRLGGFEFEVRQDLGRLVERLDGLGVGFNATFIDAEVTLPDDEAADFADPDIAAPMPTRDMTGAPEHLFNLNLTYDIGDTQMALFYNLEGDKLVSGAATADKNFFIPNIYQESVATLNFSISQKLGKHTKLQFQAKNLLNPEIEEVYRSEYIGGDVTKTSYTKGVDFSISLTASF